MGILGFEYTTIKISDLIVDVTTVLGGKKIVNHILVNDEPIIPTERFWHSLCSLYSPFGITKNIYSLFDYDEVFNRLSDRSPKDRIRITIQRELNEDGSQVVAPLLLAATNPSKPMITYAALIDILDRYKAEHITYCDGLVTSWHTPRIGGHQYYAECPYTSTKHPFENRYMMEVPIDSYGKPVVFPSVERMSDLSRWVTRNATSLKSEISLGRGMDVVAHAVGRVLESFNSDEAYAVIRNRIETSMHSWASVYECNEAYKLFTRLMSNMLIINQTRETVQTGGGLIAAFHTMTGDTSRIYGFATLDALAAKKQRGLPVGCTVYDLLGFLAHAATYEARIDGANSLYSMIGMLIGDGAGYDLENLRKKYSSFSDFKLRVSMRDIVEGKASLTN